MTVWIVLSGAGDEIEAVFSTQEKATSFLKFAPKEIVQGAFVEEWEVDEIRTHVDGT